MGQKVNPQGFRLGVSQAHISHWFAKKKQYSQLALEDHVLRDFIEKKFPNAGISAIHIERQVETIKIEISSARPRQLLGLKDQNVYAGIELLREQLKGQLKKHRQTMFAAHLARHRRLPISHAQIENLQASITNTSIQKVFDTNSNKPDSIHYVDLKNNKTLSELCPDDISIELTKVLEPDTSAPCLSEFIVEQLEKRIPFRRAMKQAILRAQKAKVKGIKVQISGRLNGAEIARSEWILKGRVPLHTLRAKVQYNYRTARTIYGLLGVKVWVFTDN